MLLQEVWVDADAIMLIRAARRAGLVHATHFRSGVFGAGLVTLSRWPIVRHAFWKYAASGFASALACGDFYAGKGASCVAVGARALVCLLPWRACVLASSTAVWPWGRQLRGGGAGRQAGAESRTCAAAAVLC